MEVLVFKTNLTTHCVSRISHHLDAHPHISRWNVDLQDCDNILRIETEQLQGSEIESMLTGAGYYCEELQ
ncbi:MAG: hypothetical protein QM791_22590 [Ferruginibacter sp.]